MIKTYVSFFLFVFSILIFMFLGNQVSQAYGQNQISHNHEKSDFWLVTEFDSKGGPFDCCREHRVWTSNPIYPPTASELLISANIEAIGIGEFEIADTISLLHRFDNGDWLPLFTLKEDFQRSTFSVPLKLNGKKLQIRIAAETSDSSEIYKVHQLSLKTLKPSKAPSFPPTTNIDPRAGMQTAQGTLIMDGGKMERVANHPTIKEFIRYTGGIDQPIVVCPTASNEVEDVDLRSYLYAWSDIIGFKDVSLMHSPNRDLAEANTVAFVRKLKTAKGLFMRGGRQWRLVDTFGNATEQTEALKEMFNMLDRGGVIAGTSAGATVQGDFMPRGFTGGSGRMISRNPKHRQGFAFLPNVAFDVHVSKRSRTTDLHEVLSYGNKSGEDLIGIGIDEGTAIVVQGKVFRVIGTGRVFVHTFVDGEEGNQILLLKSGDRYNLSTREKFVPKI